MKVSLCREDVPSRSKWIAGVSHIATRLRWIRPLSVVLDATRFMTLVSLSLLFSVTFTYIMTVIYTLLHLNILCLGSGALGRGALGRGALGSGALGREALGREALGSGALGREAPSGFSGYSVPVF